MPALTNSTAIPRFYLDNFAISCFPDVWIHTMYTIDYTQCFYRQSMIFSCNIYNSSLHASLNRITTGDEFNKGIILEIEQIANGHIFVKEIVRIKKSYTKSKCVLSFLKYTIKSNSHKRQITF